MLAILVKAHKKNITVKMYCNLGIGQGGDIFSRLFLFLALATIFFSGMEPFDQFW